MSGSNVGAKGLCAVIDDDGTVLPCLATDNGDGTATLKIEGGTSSGASADDGDAFVAGTTSGTPAFGVYESTPSTVTDGDVASVGITSKRAMKVSIETPLGQSVADDTNDAIKVVNATAANFNCTEVNSGSIKTSVELLDNAVDGNYLNVNFNIAGTDVVGGAGAVTSGVQRVTLASDDPAVVSLAAIKVAIEDTDPADVVLQAETTKVIGTVNLATASNAIGKLAANSGIDIGDVDVTSIVPGTAATNLGKAEDAAHTSGDVGVLALGVRKAATGPHSGADGDYEPLQTDANGHLKVNVIDALPAGEAHLGAVGGNTTVITVAVAETTHASYVTGDFVGTDHTAIVFANAARVSTGSGVILSAVLIDYGVTNIPVELWLFDTEPAGLPDDSAAFTLTDASTCIGVIPFYTYYSSGANSISQVHNVGMAFKSSGTSLWGAVVSRGTASWASNDLNIRLTILQD